MGEKYLVTMIGQLQVQTQAAMLTQQQHKTN